MSLESISALRKWSRLAAFALLVICALPQSNTQAQTELTVRVPVVDQDHKPLANGKVTIKRPSGSPKFAEIVGGVGNVKGTFQSYDDYEVKVEAEGYQQPQQTLIPQDLIKAAIKDKREVTLSEPIRMVKAGAPIPDPVQFQQQLSQQLLLHPELLQTVLRQAEGQPQLQQALLAHLRGNPVLLKQLATGLEPGQGIYWWRIISLIAFMGAGMLIQHLVEKDIHRVASAGAIVGHSGTQAAPMRAPDEDVPEDGDSREIASILEALKALTSHVTNLQIQQESLVKTLAHVKWNQAGEVDVFTGAVEIDEDAVSKQGRDIEQSSSLSPAATETPAPDVYSYDFGSRAQSSYRSLVRDGHTLPAPLYLEAEVKSSPKDLMGDQQIFLLEVSNTQGAFVLFADESGKGLVFPNPHLKFSQPALRPVFPSLKVSDFNDSKESITPVSVIRVGDRWRVEQTH